MKYSIDVPEEPGYGTCLYDSDGVKWVHGIGGWCGRGVVKTWIELLSSGGLET